MADTSTYTTFVPASDRDVRVIADLIRTVRSMQTPADSGKAVVALIDRQQSELTPTLYSTLDFNDGKSTGVWVATADSDPSAAILYLHGRRFQFDEPVELFAPRLAEATGIPVLKANYRLAPKFPYPAALDDTLAIYQSLLNLGIPAHRIVFVGHSAGATLALSAAIRLMESGKPLPAAIVALSAIVDFTFPGDSIMRNSGKDIASREELLQARTAYLGSASPEESPQSPVFGSLKGFPPILIASGGNELLLDDCRRFAQAAFMTDVDVSMEIFEGMPHGFAVTHTDASGLLLQHVAQFVQTKLMGRLAVARPQPLTIKRIGWAAYLVTSEHGTKVLIDPYLTGSEGFHQGIPESTVTVEELAGVDLVAVTHAGFDHRGQSLEIVKAGNAFLACGSALYEEAAKRGIPPARVGVMVSGCTLKIKDVSLKAVPARHQSSMTINGGFRADEPLSFILSTAEGSRIFCGGDSSISVDMKTWGELYNPQIAVLAIGGIWVGPLNVTNLPPAEAATVITWLGVKTVIPVHYPPGDPAPAQLKSALSKLNAPIEVAILGFGDIWSNRTVLSASSTSS